mgnify:FL=1
MGEGVLPVPKAGAGVAKPAVSVGVGRMSVAVGPLGVSVDVGVGRVVGVDVAIAVAVVVTKVGARVLVTGRGVGERKSYGMGLTGLRSLARGVNVGATARVGVILLDELVMTVANVASTR